MKTLGLALAMAFMPLASSYAQAERPVFTLNQDSCWIGSLNFYDGPIQSVNFATKEAGSLGPHHLEGMLSEVNQVTQEFLDPSLHTGSEWLFHCGSEGLSIVLNQDYGKTRLCSWARFDGEQLKLIRVGVEPHAHTGHCSGAVFGEAIVTLERGVSPEQLNQALNRLAHELELGAIEIVGVISGVLKIRLVEERHYGSEEALWALLEKELSKQGLVRAVEMNFYHHEVGEFLLLDL